MLRKKERTDVECNSDYSTLEKFNYFTYSHTFQAQRYELTSVSQIAVVELSWIFQSPHRDQNESFYSFSLGTLVYFTPDDLS